ncbi:MAG TPA: hypothetical protein VNX65_02305 [Patescibacteria group bacterium]|jgi:hypothetical protein|nr:hypothetical protein [Patescibacteria group bacterium]
MSKSNSEEISNPEILLLQKEMEIALLKNNKEISQDLDRTIDRHMSNFTKLIQPLSEQTMKLATAQEFIKKDLFKLKADLKIHKKALAGYVAAGVIVVGVLEFFIKMIMDTKAH